MFGTTVTERYEQQWVRVPKSYVCGCGHKFKRMNSDWFTMNPFNTKSAHECRQELTEKMNIKVRNCPKCNAEVSPQG